MFNFPFWMARLAGDTVGSPGNRSAGLQPFVFFSPRKLAAYLAAQNVTHWRLYLMTRYSVVTYLTELQLLGYSSIYVNPDDQGNDGTGLEIGPLIEQFTE